MGYSTRCTHNVAQVRSVQRRVAYISACCHHPRSQEARTQHPQHYHCTTLSSIHPWHRISQDRVGSRIVLKGIHPHVLLVGACSMYFMCRRSARYRQRLRWPSRRRPALLRLGCPAACTGRCDPAWRQACGCCPCLSTPTPVCVASVVQGCCHDGVNGRSERVCNLFVAILACLKLHSKGVFFHS